MYWILKTTIMIIMGITATIPILLFKKITMFLLALVH